MRRCAPIIQAPSFRPLLPGAKKRFSTAVPVSSAIAKFMEKVVRSRLDPVDTTAFDDPLADQVDWLPMGSEGAGYRPHHLVVVDSGRVEFRPSIGTWLKVGMFLSIALGLLVLGVWGLTTEIESDDPERVEYILVVSALVLFFAIPGAYLAVTGLRPRVFDRGHNAYWKGFLPPGMGPREGLVRDVTPLHQVRALQLIVEEVNDGTNNFQWYTRYELNLVLQDGSRVHVVGQDDGPALREDTAKIAALLRVPTWDSSVKPARLVAFEPSAW